MQPKETEAQKIARLKAARLAAEARKPKSQAPQHHILHKVDTELKFGKYTGSTVEEVLDTDPQWVQWAIDNINTFEVNEEVIEYLHYLSDPRRPVNRD